MAENFKPRTAEELREAVAWAVAEEQPLEIRGHGSKAALGRPTQAGHMVDLGDLSGVTLYEPDELVLTARAGTPLAEIETLLAEHNQELAFEPMDYGLLLGERAGRGTLGGLYATNLAGPRRIKAGAARDHVLGVQAVSGRGEVFKSGGRVVKNVTGYDLSKAIAGSWGTLAVASEVTFKVLPKAETQATIALTGLDDARAVDALAAGMGSSAEVSAAAHVPADTAGRFGVDMPGGGHAVTLLRLEGIRPSVDYRAEALSALLAPFGSVERVDAAPSAVIWRAIRDVTAFAGSSDPVWKLSVTPSEAPAVLGRIRSSVDCHAYYDWAGGLIWLMVPDGGEAHADVVRGAVGAHGHATLIRAPAAVRAAVAVFQPQEAALALLGKRLKQQFDPQGILNPGRMVAGCEDCGTDSGVMSQRAEAHLEPRVSFYSRESFEMSMQSEGGANSYLEPGGNNVTLVYILYLAAFVVGLTALIGLVFAYLNRGKGPAWTQSHYTYQIRTFWIGLLYSLICVALAVIGIGFILMIAVAVWMIIRCIKGLQAASRREAIADPQTWLI
ncbi:glycolate oxidase subunit GlcE [Breoghania sp. L-A4]|nr:glycolate oxidase subunit GlcE [Breoghania sp. L-A4]